MRAAFLQVSDVVALFDLPQNGASVMVHAASRWRALRQTGPDIG